MQKPTPCELARKGHCTLKKMLFFTCLVKTCVKMHLPQEKRISAIFSSSDQFRLLECSSSKRTHLDKVTTKQKQFRKPLIGKKKNIGVLHRKATDYEHAPKARWGRDHPSFEPCILHSRSKGNASAMEAVLPLAE